MPGAGVGGASPAALGAAELNLQGARGKLGAVSLASIVSITFNVQTFEGIGVALRCDAVLHRQFYVREEYA